MSGSTFGEPVAGGQALEAQGLCSRGSGVGEQFEVRKYGHQVPLGDSTCRNCGRAMKHNLAGPHAIVMHVDDGEPNDCRESWPAVNIERPEIDEGAVYAEDITCPMHGSIPATALEQAQPLLADGLEVEPVEPCGSDIGVFRPRLCVLPKGHGGDWHDDGSACWSTSLEPVESPEGQERSEEDEPCPSLNCHDEWPTIADAGTAEFDRLWAELEDGPEPVVELDQEIDCCARAAGRHTRGGPDHCGLCGKPFDVPLPPVGDETREHPGGRPTEGAAGEVSRG